MGILDGLEGMAGSQGGNKIGGLGDNDVSAVVTNLMGEGGKQLPGLLEKFHAGGFGNLAQSWVGKGANLPVSADQIKSVLGSDAVAQIAAKLGISPDQAAAKVSAVLPQIIDKLTPDGVVPDPEAVSQKLIGLLKQ
ncbi:MAG: YidB family protein [Actinobacteria bacterium]|nr:YidB family protein [Actinomycetota bacterium]